MARKRVAVIDRELCRPQACGNYLCQKVCPVDRAGTECITASLVDKKALINEETCIGCQICVIKCPFGAIKVINLPQPLDELPIHSYGRNLFSLYRLPVPRPGSVVALIGENGLGKSTLLQILSGRLKPNRGGQASWAEVVEAHRGTELQKWLERLSRGEIRASLKPQQVEGLADYTGKVSGLFEKLVAGLSAEARGKAEQILADPRLGMAGLMEKETGGLSGGELQMVAIAGALVRPAELLFFDEPSSYLDVEQRLSAAAAIRDSAGRGQAVLVVEHDLAVADYLADETHILYGSPGAYGVVSAIFSVRSGINAYLDGYIKSENMRFRPEPLIFSKGAKSGVSPKMFLEFPAFEKHFAGFSLTTEAGMIHQGEVVGVVGPNATGKTTFIRLLAGELEADNQQDYRPNLRLSVKPQRLIVPDGEQTMGMFLQEKGGGKTSLVETLRLERLLDREMGTLSGGELQRVFLAAALGKDHDLLLADEPSAFLDVEQRLRVARLLRTEAEQRPILVVDHDLQFMDAVADRLMVFEGVRGREGVGRAPEDLRVGMNRFLRTVGVTFRRDPDSGRPRANKQGSQLDREQKESGEYYYAGG